MARGDEENLCLEATLSKTKAGLYPVHLRHHDVHDDDVGLQLQHCVDGKRAVWCIANNGAFVAKDSFDSSQHTLVIVY